MAQMKTLPKVLIGIAVIGGLGYAAMQVDLKSKLPKEEAKPVAETVVTPPTQAEQQAAQAPAPQAPAPQAPAQQPSTLTPAAGNNAGLDNVLNAGKK